MLMHEYGFAFHTALHFPMAAGLALSEAIYERHGVQTGHSFVDRAIHKAMDQMKAYLKANYTIPGLNAPAES